jgi:hypothetical protein
MTSKLFTFKFEDSGYDIAYRKISYNLSVQLAKVFPPPNPPKVLNHYDTGDREEENPIDPDYIESLKAYRNEFEEKLRKLVIKQAVVYELTPEDKKAVEDVKAVMAELGAPLSGSDKEIFISHIAITTPEDYQAFLQAVTRRSQPTKEAVDEAKERFRPEGAVPAGEGTNVSGS